MFNRQAMFSSASGDWETPQGLFKELDNEFHFNLDACATPETAKCRSFYTVADNALGRPWAGTVFVNPPYGRGITAWVAKAYSESQVWGRTVVMLLPARTDTSWWHDYVMKADEIRFIRGRLKFGRAKNSAPFPSCVVIFRSRP